MSGDDQEIEVKLTADATDLQANMEAAADQVAASNEKLAASAAGASANILQQGADLTTLDSIMAGTAKNAEQLSAQELALDRLMAAGTITAAEQASALEALSATEAELGIATEATTAATVENAVAQSALNEKIASGSVVREYSALVDEALSGNYRRMGGTVATLTNRLGLMSAVFSPLGAAVAAAAGVLAVFITGLVKGTEEEDRFEQAVLSANGAMGVTADQLHEMATAIAVNNVSMGTAVDAITAVAQTGRFAGEAIQQVGQAAVNMSAVTGESIQKSVAAFVSLQDEPLKAAVKLNEQYHFLTQTTYDQIAAFDKLGLKQEAAAVAQDALAQDMAQNAAKMESDESAIARGWDRVKDAISGAWDAFKHDVSTNTLADQIKSIDAQITTLQQNAVNSAPTSIAGKWAERQIEDLETQKEALQVLLNNQQGQQSASQSSATSIEDYVVMQQEEAKSKAHEDKLVEIKTDGATRKLAIGTKEIQNEMASMAAMDTMTESAAVAEVTAQEAALKQRYALGQITEQQEIAGLIEAENQKYQIQAQAMDSEIQLYTGDLAKYNEYLLKKQQLAQQHSAAVVALTNQESLAIQQKWQQMLAPVDSAFQQSVNGIIQGTETGKQAMGNMAMSIVDEFISSGVKLVTNWIASEMAQTSATATGTATRTALTTAAATETKVQSVTSADTAITASAAQAAAGSAASVSSIPVVGWAMALEVGAATLAAVLAYKGLASASGGWEDVPGTQLAMLHKNEMVLPAKTAQTVRDAVGGSGGSGGQVHFHMNDTKGLHDMLRRNPSLLGDAMAHAARHFRG